MTLFVTLCSARAVGSKFSELSSLTLDETSPAPVDMFSLLLFIVSPWLPSLLIGLISEGNTESSFVLVSSRYRLRALPVMDA